MSLLNKLRVAANPGDLWLMGRAAFVVLILPLLLKTCSINRMVRLLTPGRPIPRRLRPPRERVTYLCLRVLGLFERLSYRASCLRRSLLLFHCLRACGTTAVIQFGVKPDADALVGHCWLTIDESIYHDRSEMVGRFTRMFELPRPVAGTGPSTGGETPAGLGKVLFDR
jgi:hypothetical protein